jgi:hypothetical protein
MGFKLPGKSIQSGTSAHSSALKMVAEQRAASALKQKAYGGTKTWAQGQEDSGGTLNDITKSQRAYEKEMKAKDPSWNKREDNNWKKTQNKINAALGSSKVYDTTKEITNKMVDRDGDGTKETKVKRGLGSNKGKTLTTTEKSAEKANISTQRDIIKKSKEDKKSATTKEGKVTAKNTRDEAQKNIGEIRSGRDDKYTGTVVSRFLGKLKAKRNQKQLDKREKKNSPTKQKLYWEGPEAKPSKEQQKLHDELTKANKAKSKAETTSTKKKNKRRASTGKSLIKGAKSLRKNK